MSDNTLAYGYNAGLVPGVQAAWGARWIVTQDGGVDQVPDRQDAFGDKARVNKLIEWLNLGAGKQARKGASELLADHTISTRQAWPIIIYQDATGAVIANTNGSAGYMYVAAYRYADLPEGHKSRGLEMALSYVYKHTERDGKAICGASAVQDDRNIERPKSLEPCPSCTRLNAEAANV